MTFTSRPSCTLTFLSSHEGRVICGTRRASTSSIGMLLFRFVDASATECTPLSVFVPQLWSQSQAFSLSHHKTEKLCQKSNTLEHFEQL